MRGPNLAFGVDLRCESRFMADDSGLWSLAVAALVDVFIADRAKRKRWIRVVNTASALLLLSLIAAAVFVTFKYS